MSLHWTAKAPGDVYRYTWTPPLAPGDSLSSFTASATGATIDLSEQDGDDAVLFVSGGTAGATAVFTFTALTTDGETLTETVYLPIRASANGFSYTARDIVEFALRKVVGNGNTAEADEAEDALERLNDMLAMWRIDGLDIGIAGPLALGTTIAVRDEFIPAVKFNLRVACHSHYDVPVDAYDASMAESTKRLIGSVLLNLSDLTIARSLSGNASTAADLF